MWVGFSILFLWGEEKNKINSLKFVLTCQKAKFFLFPIYHYRFYLVVCRFTLVANGLWYGVVRDYEAKTYQFTPTYFTSHKRSQTAETRMHYTIC
jgi:hypothetical protein